MTQFSDLELDARVLQAISEAGYTDPTPIQAQAIPHALQGRDILGIAQTGTGKTASFVLPMLTALAKGRARARMPRSLVLAPTRELAAQVAENFETYSKHMKKLSMALLIGGTSFKDQDKLIDRGVDVLIATPGRLLDHFERGKLMLTGVQIMVVDEADRMLDMGFIPDIERIFKLTPFTRQTLFFSATMAPEITRITQEFLSNPVRVEVARQATAAENIDQVICKHKPSRRDRADKEKREVLRRLIDSEGDALTNGIIFCNRKRDVDVVAKSLAKHGYDCAPIHGDLDQSIRTRTLDAFRDGKLRLLIASDVAARGLDVPSVSHVFNFDIPIHSEDYVHRIGRTGRAGRSGKAISLCLPADEKFLEKVEELIERQIPVIESPLAGGASDGPAAERDETEEAEKPARKSRSRGGRKAEDEKKPEAPQAKEPNQPKEPRSRGRGKGGKRDEKVVGMGDHVPAFLMRDLRVPEAESDSDNVPAPDAAGETPETIETPTETPAKAEKKSKPRKRTSSKKKASEAEAEAADPADTAQTEDANPADDTAGESDASAGSEGAEDNAQEAEADSEPPKRKPRRRASAA